MNDDDRIYLAVRETPEGKLRIFDQHGRQVAGVRDITVYAPVDLDSVIEINLTFMDMRDGKVRINRGRTTRTQ